MMGRQERALAGILVGIGLVVSIGWVWIALLGDGGDARSDVVPDPTGTGFAEPAETAVLEGDGHAGVFDAPSSVASPGSAGESTERAEVEVPRRPWFPAPDDPFAPEPHSLWPEFEQRYADATVFEMMDARDRLDEEYIRALEEYKRECDDLIQAHLSVREAYASADRSKADLLRAEYSWVNRALSKRSLVRAQAIERGEDDPGW